MLSLYLSISSPQILVYTGFHLLTPGAEFPDPQVLGPHWTLAPDLGCRACLCHVPLSETGPEQGDSSEASELWVLVL